MIEIIAILASLLIAFGIGSNDASNALSISIGAGIIRFRKALLLFGIFVFLGIFISGSKVMKTVGKNLTETTPMVIAVSMLISAILIISSNWRKLPISTHQVIIGSLIGCAIASQLSVNYTSLAKVVISWLISPVIACGLAFILYRVLEHLFSKLPLFRVEYLLKSFLLLSASLISFNTGANELATVLGPLMYVGIQLNKPLIFCVSSFLIFLGACLLSYRVIETVGKGITALDPFSGFVAQFGAGICILMFTLIGMPISTTYSIIGGIIGVGLTKGLKTVKIELIKKIAINWIFSLSVSFTLGFILIKIILNVF